MRSSACRACTEAGGPPRATAGVTVRTACRAANQGVDKKKGGDKNKARTATCAIEHQLLCRRPELIIQSHLRFPTGNAWTAAPARRGAGNSTAAPAAGNDRRRRHSGAQAACERGGKGVPPLSAAAASRTVFTADLGQLRWRHACGGVPERRYRRRGATGDAGGPGEQGGLRARV